MRMACRWTHGGSAPQGPLDTFSAGSQPQAAVHRLAKSTLEEMYGIDTMSLYPKSMTRFASERFDYVITVCDRAAENCPLFPGDPERIHWSFADPAAVQGEAQQRKAFEAVAHGLVTRIRIWIALPAVRARIDPRRM